MKFGVIMMMAWSVGTTVVIFFAALQNVPRTLYEAAAIDGASPWKRFRHVTVPMISGTIFFLLVINTIAALQLFTEVYTIFFGAQPTSASYDAVLFYVVYLFQQAFEAFRMGYASALAWMLFVVIGVITAIQVRLSKRWVYYEQGDRGVTRGNDRSPPVIADRGAPRRRAPATRLSPAWCSSSPWRSSRCCSCSRSCGCSSPR